MTPDNFDNLGNLGNLDHLDNVLLRRSGSVAWLTLNRPDQNNAIDALLAESFRDTVLRLESDPSCDVVMITGSGRTFSTGGDVVALAECDDAPALLTRMVEAMNEALYALSTSRMIVVAVVNGIAAGAGLGIVLNADIAIAGSRAAFLTAYSKIGLTPDCGVSYLLPRVVGLGRAMELSLTNRMLRAAEALEWNLVSHVAPHDTLVADAELLAARLTDGVAHALGETKRLIRGSSAEYAFHLRDEARTIAAMGAFSQTRELFSTQTRRPAPRVAQGAVEREAG
jgi:2-(1,2-epoxy-1,2-dihydrophenyl)acetyl-CoA isomerase